MLPHNDKRQDGDDKIMGVVLAVMILLVVAIVGSEIFDVEDWKRK